ncbi:hypothetical protein Tco_0788096 [Tanacetum coccineum]
MVLSTRGTQAPVHMVHQQVKVGAQDPAWHVIIGDGWCGSRSVHSQGDGGATGWQWGRPSILIRDRVEVPSSGTAPHQLPKRLSLARN